MKEWRKILRFPNYSVSSDGEVRNDKTGRILKQQISTAGYCTLDLGHRNPQYVHRLVAMAFLDNPDNLPQVDHIDGNKLNNHVSNLRWVSVSENCFGYGYRSRIEKKMKKVLAKHTSGEEILFNSRNDVSKYFNCNKSTIDYNKLYCKGNKKGWIFEKV